MDYVNGNMNAGEKVILKARPSWAALIPSAIWAVIIEAIYVVLRVTILNDWFEKIENNGGGNGTATAEVLSRITGTLYGTIALIIKIVPHALVAFIILYKTFKLLSTKLAVTNKRIFGKVLGMKKTKYIDVRLDAMDGIALKDSALGNLLHYYTVTIYSMSKDNVEVPNIANAKEFRDKVIEIKDEFEKEARRIQADEIAEAMERRKAAQKDVFEDFQTDNRLNELNK
mgnify:CR=1 FL=1